MSDQMSDQEALQALQHSDPAVRLAAIESLRLLGGLNAIPALVEAHKHDTDSAVRAKAAEASRWLTENRSNPRDPYGVFGL